MEKYILKEGKDVLYNILKTNAEEKSNEICFNFYKYNGDEERVTSLTRKELLERGAAVGDLLRRNGAKKDDKVIIFATNTYDNILSVVGSMLCGTIYTLIPKINDDSKIDRFISVVKSLKPKFILSTEPLIGKTKFIINKLINDDICVELLKEIRFVNVDDAQYDKRFIPEKMDLDDVICVQYSSGSTSEPKGVMFSCGNLITRMNSTTLAAIANVYSGWLPMYHIFGIYMSMYTIFMKGTSANIMTPEDFIENPYRWFKLMSDTKAEVTGAPNSLYDSAPTMVPASKLKDIDLSHMKRLVSGGEPISEKTMRKFADEYAPFGIKIESFYAIYAMTETVGGGVATNSNKECNPGDSKINTLELNSEEYFNGKIVLGNKECEKTVQAFSTGEPCGYFTVKIVNPETLKECREDEIGEVWIQSDANAVGYYENKEATEKAFKAKLEGEEGYFFRTGDLGFKYDNELYVTGRIKELIIINGKNILPNDIQVKIKSNIQVIDKSPIVVFPVIFNNKEQVVIIIGINDKYKIDYETIKNDINECMLKYFNFTPYEIRFMRESAIPRSGNGKISNISAKRMYEKNELDFMDESVEEEHEDFKNDTEKKVSDILKENYSFEVSRTSNLLYKGMNSIDVVKLSNIISSELNVQVPVKFIFANPTVEQISIYIDKYIAGEGDSLIDNDKSYLNRDAILPENIRIKEYEDSNIAFKNIFLTGATGFLGAYLIDEFIRAGGRKIYCHLRCNNKEEGFERLKSNMQYYKLWKDEYKEFIVPVPGFLEKPLLGIDKDQYDDLCENIDVIYHNGAVLNFIYPYDNLKDTNVFGTLNTLNLACTGKMKYYNYISSYSVFDNPSHLEKLCLEDDSLEDNRGYNLAYSETKWVCEKIIRMAMKQGLRGAIYRPGDISGAASTGIWKYSDMVSRIISSILKYGIYPDWDKKLYMTTVDYVAKAIVNISRQEESYGRAYNLLNKNGQSIDKIAELIEECGYNLTKVGYDQWIELLSKADMSHPLKPLESLLKVKDRKFASRYGSKSPRYSTQNAENALINCNIKCKEIDSDIMKNYIRNFK